MASPPGGAVPNPIAPLTPADEGFHHQIAETFSAVASSDPAWTEKVCAMALARDGSLQLGFGLGKYPNRNVMDGYAAVSRLVLVQGPLPARRPPPKPRPLPELSDDRHLAALAAIGDEDLRERLTRLGRAILQRAGSKPV